MAGLDPLPLSDTLEFNWVFLVEILVVVILALFFLFYFNRLFATVVSYAIRAYTWNAYKAYIDIEALQISPLGGRIFFKSIRYHAHNVTVYVYEGHVTWRYWLRLVRQAEVFQSERQPQVDEDLPSNTSTTEKETSKEDEALKPRKRNRSIGKEEKASGKPKKELPCRISVEVSGVEAFIYNRSPVYDAVVEATLGKSTPSPRSDAKGDSSSAPPSTSDSSKHGNDSKPERVDTHTTAGSTPAMSKPTIPAFLRIFPIKIECKRAAAAVGNENTKNVITAKAERASGTVDAAQAGPLDLWKLLFNFEIQNVMVAMKPNRDFKELQLDAGQRVLRQRETETEQPSRPVRDTIKNAQSLWSRMKAFFRRSKSSSDSLRTASVAEGKSFVSRPANPPLDQMQGRGQWHGLMRYLDEGEQNEHEEWQQVEYAKASELVNVPKVTFRFSWDMPGIVGDSMTDNDTLLGTIYEDDINGAPPPEYGMELGVHGGFVVYGPWADRQRINLQPIFVPATYVDTTPAKPLQPGQLRVSTIFKINVIVEEDVTLRIPTREESKDPKWKGRSSKPPAAEDQGNDASDARSKHWRRHKHGFRRKGKKGPAFSDARPYGWIDITVKKDSVVNYNMDMFPRSTGYRNTLDLDVKGLEMSSSVNHGLLWRSGSLTLDADLSQPAPWNSLRKWPFNIVINDMELFILRDHLFLIIDIVNDWASGAPSDYYTFVPYYYQIGLTFNNFVMYLNVNDANIVNDPADFDRNDYLTIEGLLRATLDIPMENYRPKRNQISYDVIAHDLKMRMHSSAKSTLNTFVEDRTMAELPKLTLNGSYNGNQEAQVGNVDVLRFDIVGTGLTLKAFGFYVRQLVSLKENYFGDYMHFKTLEEFQSASDDLMEANAKTASFPKPTSINELDVILCIVAEDATVLVPTNIYSCKEFVRLELPRADLDLRIVSYYLDMGLQLSPVSIVSGVSSGADEGESPIDLESSTQFYCQHVELNGHRSFGLPPNEEAYVSQWDIDIGKITGEMSSHFVRDLALAGRAFAFSISDAENATPLVSPAVVLDATFVQVQTDLVRIWMHIGQEAFLLDLDPVKVETSDWASSVFSQRVSVLAPLITVACVDGREANRHRTMKHHQQPVRTFAFLQTGVSLDVVGRKHQFEIETKRQQRHFKLHDQRTGRFPFLVRPEIDASVDPADERDFEPPAIPYPFPPQPLTADTGATRDVSVKSLGSIDGGKRIRTKSSHSSLSASIRNGRPVSPTKRPSLVSRPTDKTESDTSASYHSLRAESQHSSDDYISQARLPNDAERAKLGLPSSTMAFSSPYSEPYFPLVMMKADETNVPPFIAIDPGSTSSSDASSSSTDLVVDPDVDQGLERVTVMIKVVPGIRAYVEPRVAIVASKLVEKVLPKTPEEIMDTFQMSVMDEIQNQHAIENANSKIVEIRGTLQGAYIRVVAIDDAKNKITDQLDLQLRAIETNVRLKSEPTETGIVQSVALHTLLGALEIEVAERRGNMMAAAVRLSIDDALLWIALTKANAFHASLRDTSLVVDAAQAKYLSQLALKLVPIINDIKSRFEEILANDKKRLEYLTYVLTQHGEEVADPPFMARLMYILRAFPQHFRNTDSWKILARFRWILKNLRLDILQDLRSRCTAATLDCPEDAPRLVLESWNQWRNFDVPYVSQTTAFKLVFGAEDATDIDLPDQKAITVTFRSESLQVAIEHETNRSFLLLEETSLGLENMPPTKPEGLMLVDENTRMKTTLQMHTGTIAFMLDWSLYRVVEDVLSLKEEIEAASGMLQSQGSRTAGQALEDGLARHDVHVVLSVDTGSITLKTVNLRHLARTDGLKVSLIGTTQANEQLGQCMSVILNADTAITELHGPASRIWQSLLTSSSLYVDYLQPKAGIDVLPTVTLATAYDKLQIVVNEQVPGILHIIDAIILDEVAKINRLVEMGKAVQPAPRSSNAKNVVSPRTQSKYVAPKVHVAILSGKLHFEVSLLSTLSYLMEGTAVSARVAPSLSKENVFSIDFDVGRQKHAFVNTSSDESHTQDLLEVPPINGHIGLELDDDQTSVSIATTIEKVEIDAGAIQGVIAVLSRPEVQEVISAIKGGVQDISHHVDEVFPKQHTPKPKTNNKTPIVAYDAKLAVLGVRISASTPHFLGRSTAEVEFGIGPLHAKASNRETPGDVIPQVLANIQDIGASLKINDRGRVRPCGNLTFGINVQFSSHMDNGALSRELNVYSGGLELNVLPETAATVVDVINHLEDRIKHLDLSKEVDYLRRLRDQRRSTVIQRISGKEDWSEDHELPFSPEDLLSIKTTIELKSLRACWLVDPSFAARPGMQVDDLVFSVASVEFTTRKGHEARLTIVDMQLQLCKKNSEKTRSPNSALLPQVGFTVGYWSKELKRNLVFKATGKPLDLRLESRFVLPTNALQKSIEFALERFKQGTVTWESTPTTSGAPRSTGNIFDSKHLGSLLVEADFAGAQVYMQGSGQREQTLAHLAAASQQKQGAQHGRYGQFAAEGALLETTLTAPGIAFKVEYNSHNHQPTLNGELMIEASSNMLLPNVVPLIMDVSNSIKEVVRTPKTEPAPEDNKAREPDAAIGTAKSTQKFFEEENIVAVTPAKIFGKTKVDFGFRICKQEFALTCQPIARVDAKASLEDLYITMNTIDSDEHGHFFAMSAVVTKLAAEVKHVYSREPTFSYDMESIVLSAMNNKHLSGSPGVSAILNFNPTKIVINGKQFQDLLLFREIWLPPEIRNATAAGTANPPPASSRHDEFLVQKYQTVAAAAAFPWNATVSIKKLAVDLDLGQSIGKSSFTITNLWAAQQKTSTWEQNLCIGMDEMAMHSTGRMSGFIELKKFAIRTSIHWPDAQVEDTMRKTPLVQASVGFKALRAKAAFDYQAFAFGDIEDFDFLMYNVRDAGGKSDRLVTVLDCGKAYIFCTSTSPAQAVGLYQAFDRLIQEKQVAYEQSLRDIEKHLRRESTVVPTRFGPQIHDAPVAKKEEKKSPISLHTDVVVTMGAVSFGVYPSTFFDSQMLKLEASNIQARFAVGLEKEMIISGLGMTLGQLQVALSSVRRITAVPKALEVTVDEVVNSALNSKGGIILRVPKVIASMQTWQSPHDNNVDYIFKSLFEGKIDVGWNLSRINFIKNMWTTHSRALASRLGKSLPEPAVKITAGPQKDDDSNEDQEKITAEINLPLSRYEYHALEPPVIETPQLRDMGEATPPLEWIGLNRERLPNVTHQIIIVSLLEVCREVEDAYEKILGSS